VSDEKFHRARNGVTQRPVHKSKRKKKKEKEKENKNQMDQ